MAFHTALWRTRPNRTRRVRFGPVDRIVLRATVSLGILSLGTLSFVVPEAKAQVRAPVLLDYAFEDSLPDGSAAPLRDGDTLVFLTRWTVPDSVEMADSLEVTADFSRLEQGASGSTYVEPLGGGVYRFIHQIPLENTRSDSAGLVVPVRAQGPDSSRTDRRIRVCLSNHPPVHLISELVNPKQAPYHNGDTLLVRSVWVSESGLPLKIDADMSNVEADSAVGTPPRVSQQAGGVFLIHLRIPLDVGDLQPEGPDKLIPIIATEIGGCGRSVERSIFIDLDTHAPPYEGLSIDELPNVTTSDSLVITGTAEGAAVVVVLRDLANLARVRPDAGGRFRAVIPLPLGVNGIQIRAEDEAGNTTLFYPTNAISVTRVSGAELLVGEPYSRRDRRSEIEDDISLFDPSGMGSITVRVFNLEGDCVFESAAPGPQSQFSVHWGGEDQSGRRLPQGYYLVRATWNSASAGRQDIVRGLLLKD